MTKTKCEATYQNGNPCRAYAVIGPHCRVHSEEFVDGVMSGEYERKERLAREHAHGVQQKMQERHRLDQVYRGFRLTYRGHGDPATGEDWQVVAETYEAAVMYCEVIDKRSRPSAGMQCGMYSATLDDIKGQIDDILAGASPVVLDTPQGGAVIVSPNTGTVYSEISPDEHRAQQEAERKARERHEEAMARRRERETLLEQRKLAIESDRRRKDADAKARRTALLSEARQSVSEAKRKERSERRRQLADLHERQDVQGLQRTNLEGDLLCDSCRRVYHKPDFLFCYGCSRGKRRRDHQHRVDSGEIDARQRRRDAIRDAYLAPIRDEESIELADASTRRKAANSELKELLPAHGFANWDANTLHNFCASSSRVHPTETHQAERVIAFLELVSEPTRQHIQPWISNLQDRLDKSEIRQ